MLQYLKLRPFVYMQILMGWQFFIVETSECGVRLLWAFLFPLVLKAREMSNSFGNKTPSSDSCLRSSLSLLGDFTSFLKTE